MQKINNIQKDFKIHLSHFLDEQRINSLFSSLNDEQISTIRLNEAKVATISDIFSDISEFNPFLEVNNAFYYDKRKLELGKSLEFNAGAFYIQDPAAMLTYKFLDVKENDFILDMCAAPGGKSFNILNDLRGNGLLVSCDLSEKRAEILSSNIEKFGFANCIVINGDSNIYKNNFKEFFDKIVLDAPCSGSFMFRKNEESFKDWSIDKVIKCSIIQKELLENAYYMLKGKGRLVYSTCSISKEENEDVINEFLKLHSDMQLINIDLANKYDPTISIPGGLRLYPDKFKGEGQIIFALEKKEKPSECYKVKEIISNHIHKEVIKFLDEIKFEYQKENIVNINDKYYYCPFKKIKIEKVKILRYGLVLGEIIKDRFVPNHALAMYAYNFNVPKIELTKDQALDYFKGYSINFEGNSSYKIVTYKNLPLGFVKHSNNLLKNHLPTGLRQFGIK